MKNKDTEVMCDVSSCIYNDNEEGACTLNNLKISSSCEGDICSDTSSTLCQSFENSGGIITDTEYEISSEFDYDLEEEKEA